MARHEAPPGAVEDPSDRRDLERIASRRADPGEDGRLLRIGDGAGERLERRALEIDLGVGTARR